LLAVLGFAIEGLFWLGIILVVGTIVFGFVRRGANKAKKAL
jgi:hypothetical protein